MSIHTYHVEEVRNRKVVAVRGCPDLAAAKALVARCELRMRAENRKLARAWEERLRRQVADLDEPPDDTCLDLEPPQFRRTFRVVACEEVGCWRCEEMKNA